jgi:hypothetical protein
MIQTMKEKDFQLIASRAQTNTATASASFDTLGSDWATVTLNFGARLNTNAVGPTISLLESDDTVVTNHVTITANRVESLATAHLVRYEVDLRARKRYLRLTVTTATATNDDITHSALGTLSRLADSPDSTTDMVNSTNDAVVSVLT